MYSGDMGPQTQSITRVFCDAVFSGLLGEMCKNFQIRRRERSQAKRIETYHVRDQASNARYFTVAYVIEVDEPDIKNDPALVATHAAGQFAGMLKDELHAQNVKKHHDVLVLFDALKPPICLMKGDEEGVVQIGMVVWLAVPGHLQDGLKHIRPGPTQEELQRDQEKALKQKCDVIAKKVIEGAYKH